MNVLFKPQNHASIIDVIDEASQNRVAVVPLVSGVTTQTMFAANNERMFYRCKIYTGNIKHNTALCDMQGISDALDEFYATHPNIIEGTEDVTMLSQYEEYDVAFMCQKPYAPITIAHIKLHMQQPVSIDACKQALNKCIQAHEVACENHAQERKDFMRKQRERHKALTGETISTTELNRLVAEYDVKHPKPTSIAPILNNGEYTIIAWSKIQDYKR